MTFNSDEAIQFAFLRECTLIARKWRTLYDARIAAIGLTAARASVLYWVAETPALMTQAKLASIIGVEGPTLVRQLHALESQGLIRRVPVPDLRAKGIVLTAAGAAAVKQIRAQSMIFADDALDGVPARSIESSLKTLQRVREVLEDKLG